MPVRYFLPKALLAAFLLLPDAGTFAAEPIPLSQLGAKVTAEYQGSSTGITPTAEGATLRCGFQKLAGRVTPEGLWLSSTEEGKEASPAQEFRILATALGRTDMQPLPATGRVTATDKLVQLLRPHVVEEYSVNADGMRQDFIILQRPPGGGNLRLALGLSGAHAEPAELGARLTLSDSHREIAYSRLRVTDATGKELTTAKIEVITTTKLRITVDDTAATYPLRIDPTFSDADWLSLNPDRLGLDGSAYAVAGDAAGNVYVGGTFTKAGTVDALNIARWDGTRWWPMGAGLGQNVSAIAVMNGQVFAAGSTPTVMRWDGTSWHPLGSAVTGVTALAVKGPDLFAAGSFLTADGITVNRIARWDGATWSALSSGLNGQVLALTASDAGVQVAGAFTEAGGVSAARVAQWNGSEWAAMGAGQNATVRTLLWYQGSLWAGGDFTRSGSVFSSYVARWNGTTWENPNPSGSAPPFSVSCLASTGTDLFAARFSGSSADPDIYRYDTASGQWTAIGTAQVAVVGPVTLRTIVGVGSDLYAAGGFIEMNRTNDNSHVKQSARRIARWSENRWRALSNSLDGEVNAMVVAGESIWLGGNFITIAGQEVNHVARWNGSSWQGFGTGINGEVTTLAVHGAAVYAGGSFSEAGGVPASNIARWNGTAWTAMGDGLPGAIQAMVVDDGDVYAANLSMYSGRRNDEVALWREGEGWQVINSVSGLVYTLALFEGDLIVGGSFVGNILRRNEEGWDFLGGGCDRTVSSLLVQGDDLYVGGLFTRAGTVDATSIAQWDGSAWHALGDGFAGAVSALTSHDGDIFAAGGTLAGPNIQIRRWNGSSWTSLGTGLVYLPYNAVLLEPQCLAISPAGNLLIGGFFFQAGTTWSPFMVQANLPGTTLSAQETWRQTHFGSYANSGSAADAEDYDHDGLVNLVEYAFRLDPTTASSSALPQPQLSGSSYTVSFQEPTGTTGVIYAAEWSTTLAPDSWQPLTDTGTLPQHTFSIPIGTNTKLFIRLKVTAP